MLSSSNRRWHGERMMPPPGSRVISCENTIRPPAITDGPRFVVTHLHPSVVKEPGDAPPPPPITPIAPPGVVRAGGAISHPHGERSWARDLTVPDRSLPPARCCPSRTTTSV